MITLEEKTALLRAKNPTAWNKYYDVQRDEKDQMYVCAYFVALPPDFDRDTDVECYTKDERARLCWFNDYDHMIMVDDVYSEQKREVLSMKD